MATPYTPNQLSLPNFDAIQTAIASWLFSSLDTTVTQKSFQIKIYYNSTGLLALDTGVVTNSLSQYTIPANTLVNRTEYKWQIQYTDSANNASAWSSFQVFTCSSLPVATLNSPTASQNLATNVLTVSASYQQSQGIAQQNYRIVVFTNDQTTIAYDSGTVYNTANQYTVVGITNGTYFAQATFTSADGLQSSSGKIAFTISYSGIASSPSISTTSILESASIRIDWSVPKSIMGKYVGSGATYKTGKFNQAIQVANLGEKVYWTSSSFSVFTYTSWWIPNAGSTVTKSNQIIARVQADNNNYVQLRYDSSRTIFILEQFIGGTRYFATSQSGLTFTAGSQIFVSLRQDSNLLDAFVGLGGSIYKFSTGMNTTGASNTYGQATYGTGTYAIDIPTSFISFNTTYIGCSPQDGNESNALFDQTGLTTVVMSDTTIQSLYTNATLQQFTIQNMFLANFDGTLEGGTASAVPIDHWNLYRLYNGTQKLLGTIKNTQQVTASFTDATPLSNAIYQYNIVPVDTSGNIGSSQTIQASVSLDGWWLTDSTTGTSFQFLANLGEVSIKTNYKRSQYETFGTYPIPVYSPVRYRSGKLSGFIANALNGASDPYSQYQKLQSMIDTHNQLVLRNSTGWGMIVDCYDPTDTLPSDIPDQYNKVEISWTEVASA